MVLRLARTDKSEVVSCQRAGVRGSRVVGQFEAEASQTRDSGVAKSATLRAARPDSLDFARGRLFAAQKQLAQDDNETDPLRVLGEAQHGFGKNATFKSSCLPLNPAL